MVAGFWDDLDPSYAGDIYEYYDAANHRWIVEFDGVVHYGGSYPETFQTILYDPAYHTTETGDGEIVYMYQSVSNGGSNTLGIENSSETDGIEYLYNGNYADGAAALFSTQAIKFTTNSPIAAEYVWLLYSGNAIDDSTHVGNGDGAASPGEAVEILVTFNNIGNIAAENATAVLSTADPDANVIDSLGAYGSIPAGMSRDNSADPFRVSFLPEPSDSLVEFDIVVSADGGYQNASKFLIQLVEGPVGLRTIQPGMLRPALMDPSPNPFNRQTRIAYELPAASDIQISLFNVSGQLVRIIEDGHSEPGIHSVLWDGRDDKGAQLASGLYFCRFVSGSEVVAEKKVMLLR
jgi:hypothetical protein